MHRCRFRKLFALTLGIYICFTYSAYAQRVVCEIPCPNSTPSFLTPQILIRELLKAQVVYLGETHDSTKDHEIQLKIIQELHKRNQKIAIALEMFQRPFQRVIDNYLAGKITEAEFLQQSEYEKRWGFPWELYAPILRFAKEKQIPVLALNTRSEITRKVVRQGLESLTPEERKQIPPESEIRTDNPEYRQMLLAAFEQHQSAGHGNAKSADRFFLAQVLWDETMAQTIAQFITANPNHQVIVLAGQGHIVYGYGIPSRVAPRLQGKQLIQRSVLLSLPEDFKKLTDKPIADFIWQPAPAKNVTKNGE